jgi:hypothetical protein
LGPRETGGLCFILVSMDIRKVPTYYINLPGEPDDAIRSLLTGYGFTDIRRTPGVLDKDKAAGVAKAHLLALETALAECDGPFIILEEDVDFYGTNFDVYVPEDADAIYLGASMWGISNGVGKLMISVERANNGLFRLKNMLAAHAVMHVNHEYSKFLTKAIRVFIEMGTNQDKARAETMKYWNIYGTSRPIFYQTGKYMRYTKFLLPGETNTQLINFYNKAR